MDIISTVTTIATADRTLGNTMKGAPVSTTTHLITKHRITKHRITKHRITKHRIMTRRIMTSTTVNL